MSATRLAIIVAALALMSVSASAQVGIRLGIGGIGLGFSPPIARERDRPVERYRAPQRSEHVRHKQSNDDDDVKTAKKTPATQESKEPQAQNENSSVSSLAPDNGPTTTPVTETTEVSAINENSTITGAALTTTESDPVKTPVTTADTAGSGNPAATCKRFFPTVGQTISVPCD